MPDEPITGLVVLVGAGPGDPQLLSLAGAEWLRRAEVVIYDRLAAPSLLDLASAQAELVFAGKSRDGSALTQAQINVLMIARAKAGKLVVRLKGGDPFVFGRGSEEALALAEAKVPFRVVPGVTAATGAAAYAGIPLSDRHCASSIALVTGQEDPQREQSRVNYAALAGIDTVVFYMGVKNLPEIAGGLLTAGRAAQTPVAIIEQGTTPRQRTIITTLAQAAEEARRADVQPPALVVVGEVVRLHETLDWRAAMPLAGRTVMVTRARQQASVLAGRLRELGAGTLEAPAIEIQPPANFSAVDAALHALRDYDWICLTSPNGVEAFCQRAAELGLDGRTLGHRHLAAVGAATAEAMRRHFLNPDVVPREYTTAELARVVAGLGELRDPRVLLVRADIATGELPSALRQGGAKVDELAVYRTVRPERLTPAAAEALRERRVDWLTFTSSSTVDNFFVLAQPVFAEVGGPEAALAGVRVASIGPATTGTLRRHGLSPTVQADPHDIDGLVNAILQHERSSR